MISIESQEVLKGSHITDPVENIVLEKEGYDFAGWYRDAAKTIPWDFVNNSVMEDITLYAKWNPVDPTLYAEDFAIALSDVSVENFIIYAKAKVSDKSTETDEIITVTSALPTAIGTYDVTFVTTSGKTVTVKAYVYDTVNRDTEEAMTARSFAIAVHDVNAENFIRLARAKAYDLSSLPPKELTDITVSLEGGNPSTSSKLPEKAGVYYVTFSTPSGKTTTTVTAYIYAGIDSAYTEGIEAVDFAIALRDVNEENIIIHSRALTDDITPFLDDEGLDYPDYIMDEVKVVSPLPTTTGVHDVTLVSASGKTTATVKAYVYNEINPIGRYQEGINAHDFTIALNDVNEANFIASAEAKGYNLLPLDDDYVSIPPTELTGMRVISVLPTTSGVHDVTFATPSGMTTITVKVSVVESAVTVYADDIVLSLQEAQTTSAVDLIARMNAWVTTTNPNATTNLFISSIEVNKLLQLTDAPRGLVGIDIIGMDSMWNIVKKKVFVHVYNVVNTVNQEAMNANNFEIPLSLVNEKNIIMASGVSVYDISPIKRPNERYPIRLTDDIQLKTPLPTTAGVHDVTFVSASGKTEITVQVTVVESRVNAQTKPAAAAGNRPSDDLTVAGKDEDDARRSV